jgi:nucleotide-binding universal stress UspA family protein
MTTNPIVVGVDGSPAALRALDLAAGEARRRDLPLRIVHAERESPVAVLVRESRRAALLVVGHGRRVDLHLPGLGSVARQVAAHATCPVLVARGAPDGTGDVLVGVDGSPGCDAAIGFGFEEAALHGTGLVALHAWTGPVSTGPGDMLPLVYDPALVAGEEERVLAEALAGWPAKYPDVTVHRKLVRGHAGRALVEATRDARLVVVGRHGHRAVPGWLVGSVTHALLHQAHCPIAVIRHG